MPYTIRRYIKKDPYKKTSSFSLHFPVAMMNYIDSKKKDSTRSSFLNNIIEKNIKRIDNFFDIINSDRRTRIFSISTPNNEKIYKIIDELILDKKIFMSRSELYRFLVYLEMIEQNKINNEEHQIDIDDNFIKIPVDNKSKQEPIREFKTYKILKKMDVNPNGG